MKLDKNVFVVISVVGQDLLACGYHSPSITILEAGLRIGTCSLKLRGSVFSALSSAYWAQKNTEQAIAYMQQDLSVAKSLGESLHSCLSASLPLYPPSSFPLLPPQTVNNPAAVPRESR